MTHCFFIGTSWLDRMVDKHFKALGRELADRGHQVVFLIGGRRLADEIRDANPAVYTWPSRRPVNARDFVFLRRLIRQYRPDCLIANFSSVNTMMTVGWASGVPARAAWYHTMSEAIELDSRMPSWRLNLLRKRKQLVYKRATHLVAVSEAASRDLQRVFAVSPGRCAVWPLLLRDPLAENDTVRYPRRPMQIACIGRLNTTKGQDVLIRALPALVEQYPHLQVEFVGDGPERNALQSLVAEMGLGANCLFTGAVAPDEVLATMARGTLVVVPSRSDAFPLVVIESLAMGTPVVASRVGGLAEAIVDNVNGCLVPSEDSTALSAAICRLLGDPDRLEAMSAAARKGFLARFELERNIAHQADWFEQLAAGRVPGVVPQL